ncbi:glycosyltransferase family 4 protein [Lysobacter soyae]|uniref:Glycosyltransferase family 1 protein n=1 Tax=Lysobacter soyae TaxID=2764185 RepID=A0ABX8WSD4_9GAMM|nr:glycosyltransferase family 1 protein [Lysobacter sp. CJ11]QYR53709.1 glycosyltransferase family 1 protein [Lysobacter sp. CJ11]
MHYTIVTETYPPEVNGVALTVQDLEKGLRARGHAVDVIRPRQGEDTTGQPHELLMRSSEIPRYPGMRFGHPAGSTLRKRWQKSRPDALYIATEGPLGYSAVRAAVKLGIPFATGFHTRFDQYMRDYGVPFLQPLALRWMRHFHNASDATLVPTCELADFLISMGFDKVSHLPRAVDTARFSPDKRDHTLRASWGLGPDDLAVIYLGRIAAEKNLPLAVRTFREIQRRQPTAKFIWVGVGPEAENIERANPDFVFAGLRRGDDLARHFATADMFVFPSHSETFGNVTIESMASGVPPVAYRYGAAKEHLRDGIDGFAVEGKGEDNFVDAAIRLATDAELRASMRVNARESVARLQPAQVASDLDDILMRMIRERSPHELSAVA